MKKIKYIFLLAIAAFTVPVFFAGCLKNDSQIAGPKGKTGATGAQGGAFLTLHTQLLLTSSSLTATGPDTYIYKWGFANYDSTVTYVLTASAAKEDAASEYPVWVKLPYISIYETADVISASIKKDTVTVQYTAPSGWPADSNFSVECNLYVIPLPQPE